VNAPKILVVAHRLGLGGTEKHIAQVLPRIRQEGIDVSLFVLARGGELEPELEAAGVPVAGPQPHPCPACQRWRAGWTLLRHFRAHCPDAAHFFLTEPYLIGSLAASLARIDVRIMSRRSLAHYQVKHPWLARFERRLHSGTQALIANSAAVLADLSREVDDAAKLGLIYNGIALPEQAGAETRAQARAALGVAADDLLFINVANLIPYKGHADLLDAFAQAQAALPPQWRLLIAGRDAGIGAALQAQAQSLGIAGHIVWAGERRDTGAIYRAADAFVLASHEEGFSNSLLEAMGHGLAVIATAVGGNRDAIRSGESGLLVPAGSPETLARAIGDLAGNADLRAKMGSAARERAGRLFSLDACVQRYVSLYRGIARLGGTAVSAIIDPPSVSGVGPRKDCPEAAPPAADSM
jgi:glycosyltransferase involved in cell wall biosynthesis